MLQHINQMLIIYVEGEKTSRKRLGKVEVEFHVVSKRYEWSAPTAYAIPKRIPNHDCAVRSLDTILS
jgi:hypothetical protein